MATKVIFKENKGEIYAVLGKLNKYTYQCFSITELCHFESDVLYIRESKTYKGDTSRFIKVLNNIGYNDLKVMQRINYDKTFSL